MKSIFNKSSFSIIISVLASVFLVSMVVFAASTIDLNISTGGTLTVSGTSTVSGVSNTGYITTSGNLNVSKSATIIDWFLLGTSSPSAKLNVDSYAGNSSMVTYAGPPSQNFSSNLQTLFMGAAAHNFTVLNSASVSRDAALNGINQDNSSSDSFGVYGVVEATHTSGTKNQVVGVVGNVTNSGSANVNILSGVLGVSQQGGAGTVSNLSSFYAGANSKSAGTVTNNYGLYISNEAGVGTNNYQIYSAGQLPFVVLPNANVGIGTSSPYLPLSVAGKAIFDSFKATNTSIVSEIHGTLSISGNGTSTITGGLSVSGGSIYEHGSRVCTSINGVCSGGSGGTINSGTTNRLAYYSGVTTLDASSFLTVDDGNRRLGIGTSSPYLPLSVAGKVVFGNFDATNTAATSNVFGNLTIGGVASTTSLVVGGGTSLLRHISATTSLDFTSIAANTCLEQNVTVTGAADGDAVAIGVSSTFGSALASTTWNGYVYSADIVRVRVCNPTASTTSNPAAATFRVNVWKY